MVADVRFKVRMRMRALVDTMLDEVTHSAKARHELAMAQLSADTAEKVKCRYRARVVREFPGCTVGFTHNRLYVTLPNRYPGHQVPVSLEYPRVLRGAFFPVPKSRALD